MKLKVQSIIFKTYYKCNMYVKGIVINLIFLKLNIMDICYICSSSYNFTFKHSLNQKVLTLLKMYFL